MEKQVAHIGIGFVVLAAFAALVLTGCVPGEAQIKVKSSELAKMANGEIGWADASSKESGAITCPYSSASACRMIWRRSLLPTCRGATSRTHGFCVVHCGACCRINPVKPDKCRTFPFEWTNPDSTSVCPGLAEEYLTHYAKCNNHFQ